MGIPSCDSLKPVGFCLLRVFSSSCRIFLGWRFWFLSFFHQVFFNWLQGFRCSLFFLFYLLLCNGKMGIWLQIKWHRKLTVPHIFSAQSTVSKILPHRGLKPAGKKGFLPSDQRSSAIHSALLALLPTMCYFTESSTWQCSTENSFWCNWTKVEN